MIRATLSPGSTANAASPRLAAAPSLSSLEAFGQSNVSTLAWAPATEDSSIVTRMGEETNATPSAVISGTASNTAATQAIRNGPRHRPLGSVFATGFPSA